MVLASPAVHWQWCRVTARSLGRYLHHQLCLAPVLEMGALPPGCPCSKKGCGSCSGSSTGTGDSLGAASPPSHAGASVCHAGFTTPPRGYLLARGRTGSLLSPEPALSSFTQFWVLLPKARGQRACDTAAAVTPWLGTATVPVPLFVSVSPYTCAHPRPRPFVPMGTSLSAYRPSH